MLNVHKDFVGLVKLPNIDAETIFFAILAHLKKMDCPLLTITDIVWTARAICLVVRLVWHGVFRIYSPRLTLHIAMDILKVSALSSKLLSNTMDTSKD